MPSDNPVVDLVYHVLGGVFGVWAFYRFPAPILLINYPAMILLYVVNFIPALALLLGAQTTIQQEPIRKPDDHLASEAHSPEIVQEASNTIEATQVSAMPVPIFASDTVGVVFGYRSGAHIASVSQSTPLPLLETISTTSESLSGK